MDWKCPNSACRNDGYQTVAIELTDEISAVMCKGCETTLGYIQNPKLMNHILEELSSLHRKIDQLAMDKSKR